MAKNLEVGPLCDVYGALLTEKQRELVAMYYDDDLSLAEIAENTGVTRQAVRDVLARTEAALVGYEAALGCLARGRRLAALADEIAVRDKALAERIQAAAE